METDKIIKRLEISIEFLNNELNQDIESLGWKSFIEGQKYAYQSILEELYKTQIERVWKL